MMMCTLCTWCVLQHANLACCHSVKAGNSLAFRTQKSDVVSDWCNEKGIQLAYIWYDSDISKCKQSPYARNRNPMTLLVSNFL